MDHVQLEKLTIKPLPRKELSYLEALARAAHIRKEAHYFSYAFDKQDSGGRLIFGAYVEDTLCGYCFLNWKPKYTVFKKLNIPEIQDLNVIPSARNQGIATQMIAHCETLCRDGGYEEIGIGVGMDSSFGAAQRLYVKLGYVPDGNGVTYDRHVMRVGEMRPLDEHFSLMMVKKL